MAMVLSLQYRGIIAWIMSDVKFSNKNMWGFFSFLEIYIHYVLGIGGFKVRRMMKWRQLLSSYLFIFISILMGRIFKYDFICFRHIQESSACQEGGIFGSYCPQITMFWGMLFTSIQLSCYSSLAYFLSDILNYFSGFQVVQEKNRWQSANTSYDTLWKES